MSRPWFTRTREGRGLWPVSALGWLALALYVGAMLGVVWGSAALMAGGAGWAALPVFGIGATVATLAMAAVVQFRMDDPAPFAGAREGEDDHA